MDWSRLRGKLGQLDLSSKSNQLDSSSKSSHPDLSRKLNHSPKLDKTPKKLNLMNQLKIVDKELIENSLEIKAKRKEILHLLKSENQTSKVGPVEVRCTELKNLLSKSDELNKRFTVVAKAFAAQLKAQKENSSEKKEAKQKACGLCGKTKKLTKSQCCKQWICDDSDQYVMFTYAKNSCYRNHHRYTLCHRHFNEKHFGPWQNCYVCQIEFQPCPEMYVWYTTNDYNFEKLPIPKIRIKCCNCTFESYEVEDFACVVSSDTEPTKWYCKNKKCLEDPDLSLLYVHGRGFQTIRKNPFFGGRR